MSAIKDRVAFPDDVKRVELRFENDSSGEPAVWIVMFVEDDLKPAKEKITRLREAGQKAKEVVYDCDLGVWPYFQIDTV